jgi:hypothetical protein
MADAEIIANAEKFRAGLGVKLNDNLAIITTSSSSKIDDAYIRLTSLQAWRTFVLEQHVTAEALGFYSEAQNDGLTSSVLMSIGMWRPAMKSLRSLIENVVHCLYFNDHPVEYRQWDQGKFRISFRELFDYFISHPDMLGVPDSLKGVAELKKQYGQLSNVVHASARQFRMTDEIETSRLWKTTADGVGKWSAMQKNVLRDTNHLLLVLFSEKIQGAANKGLREALALAIPSSRDASVKSSLDVKIIRP